jgi:hypothetical protein
MSISIGTGYRKPPAIHSPFEDPSIGLTPLARSRNALVVKNGENVGPAGFPCSCFPRKYSRFLF